MADWFTLASILLLLTVAAALLRCWRGPGAIERMMAAQLAGTGVTGVAILLSAARNDPAMLDAALIGTLLAAVAVMAFVRGRGRGRDRLEDDG